MQQNNKKENSDGNLNNLSPHPDDAGRCSSAVLPFSLLVVGFMACILLLKIKGCIVTVKVVDMNKNKLEQKTFLMTAEGQYNKPRAVYVNTSVSAAQHTQSCKTVDLLSISLWVPVALAKH